MTIIAIRGTFGAGKTHLVKRLMARYEGNETIRQGKQVVGHTLGDNLFVVGPYTSACGGADRLFWTVKKAAIFMERLILHWHEHGYHVVFESSTTSQWVKQLGKLADEAPVEIIQLTTPFEQCLSAVKARRAERAAKTGRKATPLDKTRKVARDIYDRSLRGASELEEMGLPVHYLDREAAFHKLCDLTR